MTAKDVVYSFKRGIEIAQTDVQYPPLQNFLGGSDFDFDKSFQIIDDYTVKITLQKGFAGWLAMLAKSCVVVLDSTELEKHITDNDKLGTSWLNDNSIGTGPFYLKEWARNERIVLEKNDNYWGIAADFFRVPKYKTFISLNVPEATTQLMMLLKGDIDFTRSLPKESLKTLEGNKDAKVISSLSYIVTGIIMNPTFAPFSDENVVQAVKYAIDYDTICKDILSAVRMDRPIVKPLLGTDDDLLYSYDLEKAKSLMAQSKYPDGFEVTMMIGTGIGLGSDWESLALKLTDDLAKIGIKIKLQQAEWSAMDEQEVAGNFDAMLNWTAAWFPDPAGCIDGWTKGTTGNLKPVGKWDYAELDKIADEAMVETDLQKRYEDYRKYSELFVLKGPWATIAQEIQNLAFRSDILGWNGNPDPYASDYATLYRG